MTPKKVTERSDAIVTDYQQRKPRLQRKAVEFSGTWKATPEEVFSLLCPAREADWIPGWTAEILYSSTGYAEDKCVFRTDDSCAIGQGLWTFTGFQENRLVQFVRIQPDTLTHAQIILRDNQDGTTTATWHLTLTALTEAGNKQLDSTPSDSSRYEGLLHAAEHYLNKGRQIGEA